MLHAYLNGRGFFEINMKVLIRKGLETTLLSCVEVLHGTVKQICIANISPSSIWKNEMESKDVLYLENGNPPLPHRQNAFYCYYGFFWLQAKEIF